MKILTSVATEQSHLLQTSVQSITELHTICADLFTHIYSKKEEQVVVLKSIPITIIMILYCPHIIRVWYFHLHT